MSSNKIIPNELSKLFDKIKHEVLWLHAKWSNYRQIYAPSMEITPQFEEQINLLNQIAPSFFGMAQDIFLFDVYLHISRLTDPAITMGKDNLSLEKLVQIIDSTKHKDLVDKAKIDLKEIESASKPFRKLRNHSIAHTDLKVALEEINRIPGISRQMVEDVLSLICQLMNQIEEYFKEGKTEYKPVYIKGSGVCLIKALKDAKTYREKKRKGLV